MVKLTNHRQVLALISELKQVADRLTSNELEMFAHLKDKYRSVDAGDFDDKICLEVMLRNVSIRAGYGMDKSEATRVIDFLPASEGKNGKNGK